jgi:TRAP-type mannitol/chloroaromatic compound transport system substrate-binding protein
VLCKASVADSFAHTEAIQGKVMRENIEKRGVKNMKWSKEMLALYKKTWNEVAAEESARDPFFKKVWDDFREFDKDYDLWSSHAFMPR